jgi:pyrroloquinoline-quinone synthase
MNIQPRLLDHPFYRAWTRGDVPRETLAAYHRSYADFIQRIPSYWQTVVNAFQPDLPLGATIVQEERDHIVLWESWGRNLAYPDLFPSLKNVILAFDGMTPSRLLGALQALETQQPEVTLAKREGLLRHYGFRREDLMYFDAHQLEEKHIEFGHWLAARFADPAEYNKGLTQGAELVYRTLDGFMA